MDEYPIHDYPALVDVFRAQMLRLNITCSTTDQLTGMTDTYTTKILAMLKRLSIENAFVYLQALGLDLYVRTNPEAMERLKNHSYFEPRKYAPIDDEWIKFRVSKRHLRRIGKIGGSSKKSIRAKRRFARMGGKARFAAMTAKQRSEFGRKAVIIRWDRAKAAARTTDSSPGGAR